MADNRVRFEPDSRLRQDPITEDVNPQSLFDSDSGSDHVEQEKPEGSASSKIPNDTHQVVHSEKRRSSRSSRNNTYVHNGWETVRADKAG